MLLLLDIGNTHTHLGIANQKRVLRARDFETAALRKGHGLDSVQAWLGKPRWSGVCLCSVVPAATPSVKRFAERLTGFPAIQLTPETLAGVGLDYPRPHTLGQDRLANAVAARHYVGAPVLVVDFGTAVTFDVVDCNGNFIGGIITPGIAVLTEYLHEKTALLPQIQLRQPRSVIGRNTRQAMLSGAVIGFRGLVRELIREIRRELRLPKLPVVATGGYAPWMADNVSEIQRVYPHLTLEGLRLTHLAQRAES